MKKSVCLVWTALVVCSLCGCDSQNEALKNNQSNMPGKVTAANLKDGTYIREGNTATNGIKQVAAVIVSGGKIASVKLKNMDVTGTEISDAIVNSSSGSCNC